MVVQFGDEDGQAFNGRLRDGFRHEISRKGVGEHHAHDAVVARPSGGIEAQLVEHGVAEKRIDLCLDKLRKQFAGMFFLFFVHGSGDADEKPRLVRLREERGGKDALVRILTDLRHERRFFLRRQLLRLSDNTTKRLFRRLRGGVLCSHDKGE